MITDICGVYLLRDTASEIITPRFEIGVSGDATTTIMRLINVSSMLMEEFIGSNIPPYAILSHTWEEGEVSYQEMKDESAKNKKGFSKIEKTCKLATADGLAYAWVDTCCIDKSSSAELAEAINSMFQWYEHSAICYVYLSDPKYSTDFLTAVEDCRWFTRGWTLQELIAPYELNFFDQNWKLRGNKQDFLNEISGITGISPIVLSHAAPLSSIPVAMRMSWAAHRQTTKAEDIAYSLLGIFDVNMPLLYGEGSRAFTRLQEEIIKSTCDLSIFAWTAAPSQNGQYTGRYSGILAKSPKEFSSCKRIIKTKESRFLGDFSVTNRGIRMCTGLTAFPIRRSQGWQYVLDLDCSSEDDEHSHLAVYLRKCGADLFVREKPSSLATVISGIHHYYRLRDIYILSKLPESLPHNQLIRRDNDLIIGSRISAVQIRVPRGFRTFNASPTSHFDSQDHVFFSTKRTHSGWCVIQFNGKLTLHGRRTTVSCLFICFGWNSPSDEIESTIVDLSGCDQALISQFSSGLEHEQHDIQPWVTEHLGYFRIPQQNSIVWGEVGGIVTMSHTVRKVFLPEICDDEMYQVDITLA